MRTNEGAKSQSTPELSVLAGRQSASVAPNGNAGFISSVGPSGTTPFFIKQNKFAFGDDVVYSHGAHNLKLGFALERVQTNLDAPFNQGGNFTFGSLAGFLTRAPGLSFLGMAKDGNAAGITGMSYNEARYFREIDMHPYVQDDWKVNSKLTLNLGVRWEFASNAVAAGGVPLYTIPRPRTDKTFTKVDHVLGSNPNLKNIDPRIGLAYDPFSDHKTSIRAGFGIFHEPVAARTYAPTYYIAPPSGATIILSPNFPDPYAGATRPYAGFAGVDYLTEDSPYMLQYNLSVQREVASGTVATLGYVGSAGNHLMVQRDADYPIGNYPGGTGPFGSPTNPFGNWTSAGTLAPGPGYLKTNPTWGSINWNAAVAHSTYHAMQAGLNRQFSRSVLGQVSYTWSKCIDDASSSSSLEGGSPEATAPADIGYDRGRCSFNVTHALRVNGIYRLPFKGNRVVEGWQVSPIFNATTGLPVFTAIGIAGVRQSLTNGLESDRPNFAPGINSKSNCKLGTVDHWVNPACSCCPNPESWATFRATSWMVPVS